MTDRYRGKRDRKRNRLSEIDKEKEKELAFDSDSLLDVYTLR